MKKSKKYIINSQVVINAGKKIHQNKGVENNEPWGQGVITDH